MMNFLTDIQLGQRCKSLRENAGKSTEDAASALGTSVQDVVDIEGGSTRPAPHDIVLLGQLYGAPASAFLWPEQSDQVFFRRGESSEQGVAQSVEQMQTSIKRFFGALAMEQVTR